MQKKVKAYGKVNIGLKVGDKRADGYHNIDSYFLRLPFYDMITLCLEEGALAVTIKGNEAYLEDGSDIMEKAARAYSERTGVTFSLDIEIEKRLPFKAGLGGGSSDAAAVLLFLNDYFSLMTREELILFSSSVGADVPFFVSECLLAHVEGLGEKVVPLCWSLPYEYVSLFRGKGSGVSTKKAYSRLDERNASYFPLPPLSYPLRREEYPNDFEIIEGSGMLSLISPLLSEGDYASLSGSGSVWFVLSHKEIFSEREEFIGCARILMD